MNTILVSRDAEEREILSYLLRTNGFSVVASGDYARVINNWSDHPADMIIVALSKDIDALEAVRKIREVTQVALALIGESLSESTTCALLREGADLMLSRPLSPQLFQANMVALSRRSHTVPAFFLPSIEYDSISLDPSSRMVRVKENEPARLTQLEFRLLFTLMSNKGHVVPNEALVERVWGYGGEGNQELVRGLVSRLRHKIEQEASFIETIPGAGYRFDIPD